jgi:hypothetical protein
MPRGSFELALDTTAEPGEESDFQRVLTAFGLDPSLFQVPVVGQADASIRAYTPGYDLSSTDAIQRVGGLEFLANLSIPDVVDAAAFRFRTTSPTEGPNGTYLPFSGKASAESITLGGLTVSDAVLEVVSDETGIRIAISGEAEVLGATFTVDGELNSLFEGNLTLTLKTGETLANAFGGLSGEGSFSLVLTGPTRGSIAFNGSLTNVPGVLSSLAVTGFIQTNGDFLLSSSATGLTLGGFSINSAVVTVNRTGSATTVGYSGTASMSLLGASFRASGNLSTTGVGTLSLTRTSGTPKFFGYSATGSFSLNLNSATSGSVGFSGSLSNVASGFVSSLSVSGNIQSNGNFSVSGSKSITQTVSVIGFDVVRIVGTFNATITQSGFSGSVTGASLQQWAFNAFTGQWYWQTLASGTATINSNGTGSIGAFAFFW